MNSILKIKNENKFYNRGKKTALNMIKMYD